MKLVCDRCHTTYTIAEEGVRGPVVTLKCQKCGHVVKAPVATGSAPVSRTTGSLGLGTTPRKTGAIGAPGGASARVAVPQPRAETRALGSGGAPAKVSAPAISKFGSDEDGRLRRAAPKTEQPAARRPGFTSGTKLDRGGTLDEDDGPDFGGATQIAAIGDLATTLGRATEEAQEDWFLSVDGDQRGPFARDALEEEIPKLAGEDVFVWREGFDDWKPLADVPELDPDLRLGPPPSSGVVRGAKSAADVKKAPWSAVKAQEPAKRADPKPAAAPVKHAETKPAAADAARHAETKPAARQPVAAAPAAEHRPAPAAAAPAPAPVAKERSGAEVVSIESMRDRRRSETGRGLADGGRGGAGIAEPLVAMPAGKPASVDTLDGGGDFAAALASTGPAQQTAPAPSPVLEPAPPTPAPGVPAPADDDELVVSEPSQIVRVSSLKPSAGPSTGRRLPGIASSPRMPAMDGGISGVQGALDENAQAAGVMPVRHKSHRLLVLAAAGGILVSLSLAGVVAYLLVGRGPTVEVREVVRVKSPEELGADADRAAARVLAEQRFAQANPTAANGAGAGAGNGTAGAATKRPAGRPGPTGAVAAVKRPDGKAPAAAASGGGMTDFFKSGGTVPGGSNLSDPGLEARPRAATRQVSDDEIQRAISRQRGTLNVCYNRALKQDESLKSVRLDMTIKVGISGRVTSASIHQAQFRGSFLGNCLSDAVKRWVLPAGGADYTAQMPVVLHAN
ncbi:MAG TPA: GYF domain-containing protein [Polyangia bacterium]|jgi:predicted Zn finger-like uncharacterized protein